MPSWGNAASRHVEEDVPAEDVEMEKLDHTAAQQQTLLPKQHDDKSGGYYNHQDDATQSGDLGTMYANNSNGPYHDYGQHEQFVASPTSTSRQSAYPPTYHTTSPTSTMYEPAGQQQSWGGGYAPSVPPSYRTGPPSIASHQLQGQIGRKPVQGTWRDV